MNQFLQLPWNTAPKSCAADLLSRTHWPSDPPEQGRCDGLPVLCGLALCETRSRSESSHYKSVTSAEVSQVIRSEGYAGMPE